LRLTYYLCLLILLAGCKTVSELVPTASSLSFLQDTPPALPAWVSAPQCSEGTICAVGSGTFNKNARRDAYKALAESISVKVNSIDQLSTVQDGDFIRATQKSFLSLEVSDVSLNGASVVQQLEQDGINYVMLELATADFKTQLRQENVRLTQEVTAALKANQADSFDSWWALRKRLAAIRVITRNQDILEKLGDARDQSANRLVEDYFSLFHRSYLARQLNIRLLGELAGNTRLYNVLSKQFKSEGIDIVDKRFFRANTSLDVSVDYDAWRVGDEQRIKGTLWVRLKSQRGQTLSQFNINRTAASLQGGRAAKQKAVNGLVSRLAQENSVAKLIQ